MKQIWITKVGGPETLELRETADPEPGEGEVRIRVRAAGVNFAETMARLGLYPDAPKLPFVPGYEVAGTIDAVGPDQNGSVIGQRVLALTRFGGYSEAVCVPAQRALPLPKNCTFASGASIPVTWLTAWHMLVDLANLRKGQRVLVHAAAGGVGTAALQIARRIGAEVIGTASQKKHERLLALGLTHAIDYRTMDFEAEVMRLTGGKGVHVVLDAVGGTSFKKSYRCLAPTGRLVMFGASAAVPGKTRNLLTAVGTMLKMPIFFPVSMMTHNTGVFGVNMGKLWGEEELLAGYLREILRGVEDGSFQPVVDAEIPLAEAAKAHARLQERENFGKVVLVA